VNKFKIDIDTFMKEAFQILKKVKKIDNISLKAFHEKFDLYIKAYIFF
jgi:hypothetical protein